MMKRIIALLLALILTVGLLPTVALAADGDTPAAGTSSDVKNGYYEDTTWKEGTLNQGKLPTGVESVSKTAKPTSNPNEYEVTLEVVLKKTESQENPGSAATVLVLDHSGSMNGCAYCKSTTDTRGNYYHTEGCKYDKPNEWVRVTSEQSRMSAATKAVKDFIKTYSGRFDENGQETTIADLNLGRWVCLVWFNKKGGVTGGGDWVDVSNKSGYQMATDTSGWSAHDGTNLDCGLRLADYQLKQNTVAKISKNLKNVIVLSDGEPTFYLSKGVSIKGSIKIGNTKYYVHGSGKDCKKDTYNTTKSTAATLRNSASVYTVCFGASGNEIKDYDKNGNQKITVGNYLKQKIATQPKSGSNEKFAYDAADADALNTAFAAISKTIVSGLSTGTVKDTLPTGISSTVFGEGKTVMNWELNSDAFNKTEETKPLADGTKETVYTYTKTYTVTIDPDNENLVKTEDGYAPLNGKTTLTVKNSKGENVEIPFPIPAGKVTPTTFTVTWKSQDGNTELEKDENVAKNSKPSYDGATPTKAEDDMYTYTFVGWALSDGQETGTSAADLPNVTADVTYYAAFRKTLRTYTVTGTIDNSGNVTDNNQTVNAGDSSTAMTFTPAAGYEIKTITEKIGDGQPATITVTDKNSYTYPAKDNVKADIKVTVTTQKRTDLSYTIKYVEKGTTNEIMASTTVDNQEFGAEIVTSTITAPEIAGFGYDSCTPNTLTIGADVNQNVITLYYTRNKYKVTYTYTGSVPQGLQPPTETEYDFGASVMIANAPDAVPGYTFEGWKRGTEDATNFSMPAENVTITGNWTKNADAGYTIEYYLESLDGQSFVIDDTLTVNDKTGTIGTTASVTEADKKQISGFTFDVNNTNNKLEGEIVSGDPLTLKLYYKRNSYKVTYQYTGTVTPEDATKLPDEATYKYGAEVTVAAAATSADYIFSGWSRTGTFNMPAEDVTITGRWTQATYDVNLSPYVKKTLEVDGTLPTGFSETFKVDVTVDGQRLQQQGTVTMTAAGTSNFTMPTVTLTYGVHTIVVQEVVDPQTKNSNIAYGTNPESFVLNVTASGVQYGSTDSEENFVVVTGSPFVTITNKYTQPTETFDLNTLITKKFEAAANSKPIPNGNYTFTAQIFEANEQWQQVGETPAYIGTATLNGAASGAVFDFDSSRNPTLVSGTHRYLVKEEHGGETIDGITYDSTVYRLTITVSEDGTQPNVQIEAEPQASVLSVQSVEFASKITFTNTYFEEKDPNKLTINFADFVKKELTATGSKTVDEATFIVDVVGSYDGEAIANALPPTETQATTDEDVLNTTLTATIKNIVGGNVYEEPFTGSVTVSKPGHYTFTLTERKGTQSGVTYDEAYYQVFVNIMRVGDNLVIHDATTYLNNEQVELIKLENDAPVTAGYIVFKNTIDTGKDDYYPIIIPTIINKDTGMLNKTDHFAYVIGYPDGTVHPNGQITRAEVATIFFRLLRDEVRDGAFTTSNTYSDVAYGKWYNNPISTMSALGIITGYPDGTFKPNKPITRAEFAAIAARFDETQSGKSATFSDVIGHWAAKEIGIAYYNDWIKGYPDGTFKPDQNITRAEAMTLINRVLERKPESPADLLTNMNKWTDNLDTSKWYYLDVQEATNSHGYTRKTFNYELWRQMLPDPDWSRYER